MRMLVPFNNSGTVEVQSGALRLGAVTSAGAMTADAGTFLSVSGPVTEQIGGLTAGTQYGQIVDNGSVALGGALQGILVNGFAPNLGDTFTILENQGGIPVSGTFAGLPEGGTITAGGYKFQVSYANGNVTLTTTGVPFHQTTTTVTASASSPLLGDTVTLTATVGTDPGAGTPTGSVQFQVDGSNLGSPVPLVNGGASLSTAALPVGAHTVTALYSGSAGFLPSQSAPAAVTVLAPSMIQGLVWVDFNDDGQVDFGEKAIAGVTVTLTGTDDLGHAVSQTTQTDANGIYAFTNLRPSNTAGYTLTETQPAGFLEGQDALGLVNGVPTGSAAVQDVFAGVVLPAGGSVGENYNFGERPTTTGAVGTGQTATIGFWQNKNGQSARCYADGVTGRSRDPRRAHRSAARGGPESPRGRQPHELLEQPQATRPGGEQL
jgi:hypothetical protein